MNTTVFITHSLKSTALEILGRRFLILCLCLVAACVGRLAAATELDRLKVERAEDGIYLSAVVQFELTPVVEDALMKGIPMFFVVEADLYHSRWYWTDRRAASATRSIRLAFQPLTRQWRVNIVPGLINNSAGLRATLNQNYDNLPEALSAVKRLSRWKIADNADVDPDIVHKLEFRFSLDLSQLPRPFQIGVAGQKDWNISVQQTERLQIAALRPAPASNDKARPASSAKEPDK